jgi:hypothetical protein
MGGCAGLLVDICAVKDVCCASAVSVPDTVVGGAGGNRVAVKLAFASGWVAGDSAAKTGSVLCGIWLAPVVPLSVAFPPVAGSGEIPAGVFCGSMSRYASRAAGTGTRTGKNAARARLDTTGGQFFCEPFVDAAKFAGAVLLAGCGELLGSATAAKALGWSEDGVERSDVPRAAAKLPAFRADELARLKKPEAELVAGVLLLAGSMAVVTG